MIPAPRCLLAQLPAPPCGRSGWPWNVETVPPEDATLVTWPRITIVTPSYQQSVFLEECLRSVLLQNYPALEFIVLDGGSTDNSAALLTRYDEHLDYWQSRPDGGQARAINAGFERGTGEIFGWLNSDDFLLPGALFAVARAFLRRHCDLVYGDALNIYEPSRELDYWQGYWVTPAFLRFGGILASHATFWRRAIHQPIWDEMLCNVDGELWQRLVPGRRLRYLPVPLAVYRSHGDTKSQASAWADKWRHDDNLIWARHGRPSRNRFFVRFFNCSQRLFKWFAWRRASAEKRAVLAACAWPELHWRTSRHP